MTPGGERLKKAKASVAKLQKEIQDGEFDCLCHLSTYLIPVLLPSSRLIVHTRPNSYRIFSCACPHTETFIFHLHNLNYM